MIDLLVQTVGKSQRGRLLDLKSTDLQEMLDANLVSSLNAIQCFTPYLSQPGGRLVLIGSLASRFAPRFLGAYALSKHALAALAQQSRLELADLGIHVLLACPGPVARPDAGARYELPDTSQIPVSASLPGGGARLAGLDPHHLVTDILLAAARKKTEIIRPRRARLLQIVAAIAPALGDRLLRNNSS
jgi:short-subunit dehydrogenase